MPKFLLLPLVLVLCACAFLPSCKSTLPKEQYSDQARKIAIARLGSDIESYPNSTGEFILFIQEPNPASASTVLKFIVVHTKDNHVVVEQDFFPGYVKWITDSSLEVFSVPGTVKENTNLTDYIRIVSISQVKH